ncbi:uncharacterized protein LOC141590485 [Silene latifolia]|uniref:uncharacterized protein LOC141590485 n=1 Tax=Silene latifolia TaxID=37657 RepID=UPI003D78A977
MSSILDHPFHILFDTGESLSFISSIFTEKLALEPFPNEYTPISLPFGEIISSSISYSDVPISISETIFPATLLRFQLIKFDVILGMDWLSKYYARFECRDQKISLKSPLGARVTYNGTRSQMGVKLISALKLVSMLSKGFQAYLCLVTSTATSLPKLEEVPVVRDFADVFPDALPRIPPECAVDFSIDLLPGTGPISKALYRMVPTELKELRKKLDDMI